MKHQDVAIFFAITALFGRCERFVRRYRRRQIVERGDQRWLIVLYLDEDAAASRSGELECLLLAVHGFRGEQAILQFRQGPMGALSYPDRKAASGQGQLPGG